MGRFALCVMGKGGSVRVPCMRGHMGCWCVCACSENLPGLKQALGSEKITRKQTESGN